MSNKKKIGSLDDHDPALARLSAEIHSHTDTDIHTHRERDMGTRNDDPECVFCCSSPTLGRDPIIV